VIGDTMRIVKLGLKSLLLHKLRSSLTTAGILFGVASVIAMLAVGEGASKETLQQYRDMGVTNVLVRSKKPEETQQSSNASSMWNVLGYGLLYPEADRIQNLLPQGLVVRSREFQRGIVERAADGGWQVLLTGSQGAGILRSLTEANALVVLGHEQGSVAAGESVEVWLFDALT